MALASRPCAREAYRQAVVTGGAANAPVQGSARGRPPPASAAARVALSVRHAPSPSAYSRALLSQQTHGHAGAQSRAPGGRAKGGGRRRLVIGARPPRGGARARARPWRRQRPPVSKLQCRAAGGAAAAYCHKRGRGLWQGMRVDKQRYSARGRGGGHAQAVPRGRRRRTAATGAVRRRPRRALERQHRELLEHLVRGLVHGELLRAAAAVVAYRRVRLGVQQRGYQVARVEQAGDVAAGAGGGWEGGRAGQPVRAQERAARGCGTRALQAPARAAALLRPGPTPPPRGRSQRGVAVGVLHVDVGPVLQQQAHHVLLREGGRACGAAAGQEDADGREGAAVPPFPAFPPRAAAPAAPPPPSSSPGHAPACGMSPP
jgi:hypothetical protein